MIDVSKVRVGDKLRVIAEYLKGCGVDEVVEVVDFVPDDYWINGGVVDINYLEGEEEAFEPLKEESGTTESAPWKIQVLTNEHEYQGLYKGSIHIVKTLKGDNSVQFYHNGKLWSLDVEDYEHYVEQALSEECRSSYCECDEDACVSGKVDRRKDEAERVHPSPDVCVSTNPLDKQVSGSHYKSCAIQPIEYIHANGLDYLQGNVIKYTTRHKDKNGKADIEKAIHYLELIIELQYKDK